MHIVIVVGSGGRIGPVVCKSLAKNGFSVVGVRKSKDLQNHPDYKEISLDATSSGFAEELSNEIRKLNPKRLGLVWNARLLQNALPVSQIDELAYSLHHEIDLGIISCMRTIDSLSESFSESFSSAVIISSIYGMLGPRMKLYDGDLSKAAGPQYGLIKSSQIHLVKELAVRYASKNLRINAISYGGVQGRVSEEFLTRYSELCPSGKMLNDEDLAGPVEFLLTENSSGVNGHNLVVDGGWSIA